jgi:hypothetical protein
MKLNVSPSEYAVDTPSESITFVALDRRKGTQNSLLRSEGRAELHPGTTDIQRPVPPLLPPPFNNLNPREMGRNSITTYHPRPLAP